MSSKKSKKKEKKQLHGRERLIQQKINVILSNKLIIVGIILTLFMVIIAVFAPLIATHDPLATEPIDRLSPPSRDYLMGTDSAGRDVFSRVVYGTRLSMMIAAGVVFFTTIGGMIVGLIAGYYEKIDPIIMRFMDGMMSFPSLLLAIAVMTLFDPSPVNVVIALSIVYTPRTARIVRGDVLKLKNQDFVEAARSLGGSDFRIIVKHILPNTLSSVIVQETFLLAMVFLAEASLSFIGAGTPPPAPSWGNVLSEGRNFMYQAPWLTMFPGLFIIMAVMGINLLGDGLRDVLDPRMKSDVN